MTKRLYQPSGDEDVLFNEGNAQLDMARTAFSYNDHQRALEHYLAAYDAAPSQTIIDDMFKNAAGVVLSSKTGLLAAQYYMAVAELTGNESQILPSLDKAIEVMRAASKGGKHDMTDHAEIARLAVRVLETAPSTDDGVLRQFYAMDILNRQMTAMQNIDAKYGTHNASVFLVQEIANKVFASANETVAGVLNGMIERVLKTDAGIFGFARPANRINSRHMAIWAQPSNNNKPRLN